MKLNTTKIKELLLAQNLDEKRINEALAAKKYHMTLPRWDRGYIRKNFEKIANIDFCIKMYEQENVPIYKMAMAYGVSDVSLREYMIKHGVKLKGHSCGQNSQNTYFSKIDTRDKAYFLGLMAADGSVAKGINRYVISIELTYEDGYILKRFAQYAKLEASFMIDDRDNSKRLRMDFSSPQMVKDLAQFGIIPNKSHLNSIFIPDIDSTLIPHFIRGYFDGDGIAKKEGYIGFCGSKTIVNQIHSYFVQLYDVANTKVIFNKWNGIYYSQWGKKIDTMKIADVLYKDSIDLYLKRKQEKIFSRLRPETWQHVDLNLSKPINIGCPDKSGLTVEVE